MKSGQGGVEQLYVSSAALRLRPKTSGKYRRTIRYVYAEAHGIALVMDIFAPLDHGNGFGIVDVVSGAWHSDRVRLNEHIGLGAIDAFCERGFTVFAVLPGSVTKFTGFEMVEHVHAALRHAAAHAPEFAIDPAALGVLGASAGGHLAALATLARPETHVPRPAAVGLFFPPTDLVDFGGRAFDFSQSAGLPRSRLLFEDGLAGHSRQEILDAAERLSPARQVHRRPPPTYLLHGSADPVVPLEQSEKLAAALRAAGGHVELVVKHGGGHPWPDIRNDIAAMADWFDARLMEA
ncbi:MAG: alpha/beta hydrolase [Candidatus Hydrogenedentes bacterium]|nr:alpha/beta hydrolase [Candidatus Hydrogenedentota bacterium]